MEEERILLERCSDKVKEMVENIVRSKEGQAFESLDILISQNEREKPILEQESINTKTYRGNNCIRALRLDMDLGIHLKGKKERISENKVLCLKEYDLAKINKNKIDLEIKASQLLHSVLKDRIVNVLDHGEVVVDIDGEPVGRYLILMDHIGENNMGKFYLDLNKSKLDVLKNIFDLNKNESLKPDWTPSEEKNLSYLLDMGFVFSKKGKYSWENITRERFEIKDNHLVENENYKQDREDSFRATIDTIFSVEKALKDLVDIGDLTLKEPAPPQIKFFEKFNLILQLLGESETYNIKLLERLYEQDIASVKKKAIIVPILGNGFLMNFMKKTNYENKNNNNNHQNPSAEKKSSESIVAVTDLGHLTFGSFLTSYSDVIEFGRIMCGFDDVGYAKLWDHVQSRLRENYGNLPPELAFIQGFDRTAYYVGVSCGQYLNKKNLTPGLERYQVDYIRKGCKHLLSMMDDKFVDIRGDKRDTLLSEKFRDAYRPIFEKLRKKRL